MVTRIRGLVPHIAQIAQPLEPFIHAVGDWNPREQAPLGVADILEPDRLYCAYMWYPGEGVDAHWWTIEEIDGIIAPMLPWLTDNGYLITALRVHGYTPETTPRPGSSGEFEWQFYPPRRVSFQTARDDLAAYEGIDMYPIEIRSVRAPAAALSWKWLLIGAGGLVAVGGIVAIVSRKPRR